MKRLKFTALVAVGLFFSTGVALAKNLKSASLTLKTAVVEPVEGKVLVGFEKTEKESVWINIYDSQGNRVYREKVKKGTVILKTFDMSHMPMDLYTWEITNRVYIEKNPVAIVR